MEVLFDFEARVLGYHKKLAEPAYIIGRLPVFQMLEIRTSSSECILVGEELKV